MQNTQQTSKHVELGNKLANVCFLLKVFKIAYGVGLFKSLLATNCQIFLCNCSLLTLSLKKKDTHRRDGTSLCSTT